MHVKADAAPQLLALASRDHFAADGARYSGVHDPILRAKLNSKIGSAIAKFIASVQQGAARQEYLTLLASEIEGFDRSELDTEDAEQVAGNFERIMDCIGLESSNGILNNWMYGFGPNLR